MNGTKVIHFLSASDRLNYGDLLFPILFKKYLDKNELNVKFVNYGIVASDLTRFKALKTHSFRELEKNVKENDIVVLGGGEILFANWTVIYAFINPFFRLLIKKPKIKKYIDKFYIARRVLSRNAVSFPFAFSSADLKRKNINIKYSSVGGGDLFKKNSKLSKLAYEKMSDAKLISLRDKRSYDCFFEHTDLDISLIPDSAITMSTYYPLEELEKHISFNFNLPDNYIFVQVGINKGPKDLHDFVNKLTLLSKKNDWTVVLCPIGLAPGHEDDVILKEIKSLNSNFHYIHPQNIFDIMYLIANATLYMGTSLHGAITAMSFQVPVVGLNKKIIKLESYLQTWVDESITNLDFTAITCEAVQQRIEIFKSSYCEEKLNEQIGLVNNNLKKIIDG